MNTRSSDGRFAFLDGLRGLAALWVVFFHLSKGKHIEHVRELLPDWVSGVVFDWGHLGVPVFFVLSGFVMAYTARAATVDGGFAGRFVLRRLIRLSPPYYFAIAFAVIFTIIKAKFGGLPTPPVTSKEIFAHLVYMQDILSYPQINTVFWTLAIEVQFYIAFALLLLFADTIKQRLTVLWCVSVLALLWPLGATDFMLWKGDFLGLWYSFLVGVMVFHGWQDGSRGGGRQQLYAALYCGVVLLIGVSKQSSFATMAALAGAAILTAGAMNMMRQWLASPWIQFLGMISYSLYLLHNPITGASFRVVSKFMADGVAAELVGCALSLSACLIGAWLAYRLIELPSIALSHAVSLKKTPAAARPRAGRDAV